MIEKSFSYFFRFHDIYLRNYFSYSVSAFLLSIFIITKDSLKLVAYKAIRKSIAR
nr:MAG TPA: hypothetical protein [Caudoviricetes sp.]